VNLILASTSAARQAMLRAAGVPHEVTAPGVDEDEVRAALVADGVSDPVAVAGALADHKAMRVSLRFPAALVLGADQLLATEEGELLDKPGALDRAEAQLRRLRGRTHRLESAAALATGGEIVWRARDQAQLEMRAFSDAFLERYLALAGAEVAQCVGSYMIEGLGAQLFERVTGDHFTIRGLPLLPVLAELRARGLLAA
jgi:septum formation protein